VSLGAARRPIAGLLLLGALATACGPVTPTGSGSAAPSPTAPTAGRPYDAAAILEAMRTSVRPGGVAAELQTEAIAAEVAASLWTWSGRSHPQLQVAGACGPTTCSLEVAGTPVGAAGTDLYVFLVTPSSGAVRLEAADLHGYPAELDAALDDLVRAQVPAERLAGLAMTAAGWQAPPLLGQFVVAYRSGGEEGSPAVDVVVDLFQGAVLEVRDP
ncbi:MAG: hypothetical protein ACRDHD_11060, partial [Candidatus Limnocylindria bacterium]